MAAPFYLDTEAAAEAERLLRDCTRYVLFDQNGAVLAASFQADPAELAELARAFDLPRDDAVRRGIALGGARFEVHRHHPEGEEGDGLGLIYGRTMGGGAAGGGHSHGGGEGDHDGPAGANGVYGAKAWSEGAAVCRVKPSRAPGGAALFGAATYALPQVSARMVPLLRDACERLLGPGKQQG